ncbi:hypothetical protein BWQ96_10762 [Gracilariopsis chorda]|uniref:Uncharacterized protein n=1 Tax=Gracilariopsis chorda TaxID=448386 RepID=A0A2V3IBQ9_9FLOR|nr:hypothetical protein BWQ96_10762 [Gracilariopsis chorda]|eukprot:PXF39539.1 hypothetical protein BWQ96_10762 [Gracilariopsis chorda]
MTAQQSAERIYYILKDALTQQAEVRKRAEKALRDAEEKEDYFASLAAIATAPNDQAESQVRWLAAVCGKKRRFSIMAPSGISFFCYRRRARIRPLMSSFRAWRTTVHHFHSNFCVDFVHCAGRTFPNDWPNILSDLVQASKKEDGSVVLHALVTLDMVLKATGISTLDSSSKGFVSRCTNGVLRVA